MSGDDSGDKTEKPTSKRIRDSRKKGDVVKSKDLTTTLTLLGWILIIYLLGEYTWRELSQLFNSTFTVLHQSGEMRMAEVAQSAAKAMMAVSLPILCFVSALGMLVEFIQVGPVFATDKIKPDFTHMNPGKGLKKLISQDNWFELGKNVLKIILIGAITYVIAKNALPDLVKLPFAPIQNTGQAYYQLIVKIFSIIAIIFIFVSLGDAGYQNYSYIKRLMMSMRDIKQESKDDEGDPMIKAKRRQLHQEWSQRNTMEAVRQSSALVVNPTHIGVAIRYFPGEDEVPFIMAKGEDQLVPLMKAAAREAGVPIMRHVPLARRLNENTEIEDFVPMDAFEAVAAVLLWAQAVKRGEIDPESGERERAVEALPSIDEKKEKAPA